MYKRLQTLSGLLLVTALTATACGTSNAASQEPANSTLAMKSEETTAEDNLPDLDGQTISVAIENEYLPFSYIDGQTGEAGGWDYAMFGEICDLLNCELDYRTLAFDTTIQDVSDGKYDVSGNGVSITTERQELIDYSDSYGAVIQRLLVADADETLTSEELLQAADCTVGSQVGTTTFDTAEGSVGADRVEGFDSFDSAVDALIAGDICAVVIDDTPAQGYVVGNPGRVKIVDGVALLREDWAFIFPKESDLVEPFNAAIAVLIEDGTAERLHDEYFGPGFEITYDDIADPAEASDESTSTDEEPTESTE